MTLFTGARSEDVWYAPGTLSARCPLGLIGDYQVAAYTERSAFQVMFNLDQRSKNDFSFVFSTAKRYERVGMEWRPSPGINLSVLPWHSFRGAQTSCWGEGRFSLDAMVLDTSSPVPGESEMGFQDSMTTL